MTDKKPKARTGPARISNARSLVTEFPKQVIRKPKQDIERLAGFTQWAHSGLTCVRWVRLGPGTKSHVGHRPSVGLCF